jgi:hypothetical protein
MSWYSRAVYVFGVIFIGIGITLLAVTVAKGGGVLGFVMGALFLALGVARIQLERKRGHR